MTHAITESHLLSQSYANHLSVMAKLDDGILFLQAALAHPQFLALGPAHPEFLMLVPWDCLLTKLRLIQVQNSCYVFVLMVVGHLSSPWSSLSQLRWHIGFPAKMTWLGALGQLDFSSYRLRMRIQSSRSNPGSCVLVWGFSSSTECLRSSFRILHYCSISPLYLCANGSCASIETLILRCLNAALRVGNRTIM